MYRHPIHKRYMEGPEFPSQQPHPVFPDKTKFEVNRARQESVNLAGLTPEKLADRIKMEVYFNVRDLVEGRASEQDALSCIFRLMELYPRGRFKK